MKVSIIIPSRNRGTLVEGTIRSILANSVGNFELFLVDQSTNDLTEKTVAPYLEDERFHYIRSASQGSGLARNIALREVSSEIVLFTDDDCIVPPNWVQVMVSLFEDERVGMAFCNVIAGEHDPEAGFIPTYVRDDDFIAKHIGHKNQARGIGAGMAVRRQIALELGGFDALLPASMDGDLAVRMLLNGWWVYETSQVAVIHDGFRTWEQGKKLAKRNFTGIGQAYSKPIKRGIWRFLPVVIYEGIRSPISNIFSSIVSLERPRGLRNLFFFWSGFLQGLSFPLEEQRLIFQGQSSD